MPLDGMGHLGGARQEWRMLSMKDKYQAIYQHICKSDKMDKSPMYLEGRSA